MTVNHAFFFPEMDLRFLESTVSNTELGDLFWPSPSSGKRTPRAPLSLVFVCQSELTELFAELTFSPPKQHSRNSIPPFPSFGSCRAPEEMSYRTQITSGEPPTSGSSFCRFLEVPLRGPGAQPPPGQPIPPLPEHCKKSQGIGRREIER